MTSIFVQTKDHDVLVRAITAVSKLVGLTDAPDAKSADWTLAFSAPDCLAELKAGRRVMRLRGADDSSSPAFDALAREYPDAYREAAILGDLLPELQKLTSSAPRAAQRDVASLPLSPSPITHQRVWVVDDSDRNLESARVQLAATNDVSTFNSYMAVLKSLSEGKGKGIDLLLTDMMMPAEPDILGREGLRQFMGQSVAAGMSLVLAAARAQIPRVIVQTDAGHHDHPSIAMIDWIGWGKSHDLGGTIVSFQHASKVQGVKDWGAGIVAAGVAPDRTPA